MMTHIIDTQTRLKLFSQCTSQKLPHLLDSDIMNNFPTHEDSNYEQWYNWAGPLSNGIDNITTTFLHNLIPLDTTTETLLQLS